MRKLQISLKLAFLLGSEDVKQAYRRSALGPYWITIGMGVQILTMGLVFGLIFKTDNQEYLPFLAISIILWGFISSTISEGCSTFVSAEAMIKQLDLPYSLYVTRTVWRNMLTTAHNFVILPVVFVIFVKFPGWPLIAFVPGMIIVIINILWTVALLGILSARYRDLPPIVASVLTIAFYITPVMWYPKLIGNQGLAHVLLGFNPIYHWLQIVRLPILGQWPTWENWLIAGLSGCIGWTLVVFSYRKKKHMIPYWV